MGGKSTSGSDVAQSIGAGMHEFGKGETAALHKRNNANLETYLPLANHLSGQAQGNTDWLTQYARTAVSPDGQIGQTVSGLKNYADLNTGAGMDIFNRGIGYADGAMGAANSFIGSLGGMAGSVSMPSINLGSVRNGTTAAGGNAQDYHNEWKNVYAPAARKLIADAQNFNTAGYREYLAQQAMADAGRQFQNAQSQSARNMGSMGMNVGSGAAAALQNQAMLANAAQRAGAGTGTRWMAEQEGWKRVNDAVNNQAGAHLMGAANDALGVEASVTNANTAAQASVANANTAAQASLANGWLDSQTALRNAQMSAAASAFNAGLDAQSKNFGTASQGLLTGLDQGMTGYNNAGGLQVNAGQLGIDAVRASNETATTSLGLAMLPREQHFQNYMSAMQPELWGLMGAYNGFMGGRNIESGNNANQAGLTNSIIGATGNIAGGWAGSGFKISDRRLKQDIVRVGTYYNGLPQYEFAYRDNPGVRYRGVMADEVEKVMPEAVLTAPDGYQRVDYALLGIEMEKV